MPVQNLQIDPTTHQFTNIPAFVNSLFDSDVRTSTPITKAIQTNQLQAGFSSDSANYQDILSAWMAGWQFSQDDPYNEDDLLSLPASDQSLLAFLSNYLQTNGLVMYVPQIQNVGATGSGPIYQLMSYQSCPLYTANGWNYDNVSSFLEKLLFGAHFVVIHAAADVPAGTMIGDFWSEFQNAPTLKGSERQDVAKTLGVPSVGNSHYASVTNLNGYYFPSIVQETAPSPCPFFVSFLTCPTVATKPKAGQYNTFFQLEGWELPPNTINTPGSRHDQDYNAYQQSYWNISTYGACPYSEKRATAIFLALPSWNPQPTPNTYMPPYVGAETPQSWLQTDLVKL